MKIKLRILLLIAIILRLVIDILNMPINFEQFLGNFDTFYCFINKRCGTTADFRLIFPSMFIRLFNLVLIPLGLYILFLLRKELRINRAFIIYSSYILFHYILFGFIGIPGLQNSDNSTLLKIIQEYGYHISSIIFIVVIIIISINGLFGANNTGNKEVIQSRKTRLYNYLIDLFFIFIFWNGFYYGLLLDTFGSAMIYVILFVAIKFLYYFILELIFNQSFGKVFTGSFIQKNVNWNLIPLILIRTLCRFIPFEPFSFLNKNGVGLHDKLSKTRLIKTTANSRS